MRGDLAIDPALSIVVKKIFVSISIVRQFLSVDVKNEVQIFSDRRAHLEKI